MKMSEDLRKDFAVPDSKGPKYPYGLRITLGPEELKKLEQKGLQVGDIKELKIKAKVVEVRADEGEGDVSENRVELQIVEMECEKEEKSDSTVLYGN